MTRLRYLGDIVLTTPVLSSLKRCYPDAEIHYLADARYAPVLEHNPHLTGVIGLEGGVRGAVRAVNGLRRMRFTAAIDLFYNPRSAWLLYCAGIPVRIGGSRRWRRRFYTKTYSVPPEVRSVVARHLYPLRILGCDGGDEMPRIYLTGEERAAGMGRLRKATGCGEFDRVVAVHPGGTWSSKRWPVDLFGRMIERLVERTGVKVLLVTGPGEEGIVREVAVHAGGGLSILPPLPLRALAGVLGACRCVVANDGGVLHMAVALGRPTVGIFGPTEPDIWFPYEGRGPYFLVTRNEKCAPCHRHECDDLRCLRRIEPDEVVSRVSEAINGREG